MKTKELIKDRCYYIKTHCGWQGVGKFTGETEDGGFALMECNFKQRGENNYWILEDEIISSMFSMNDKKCPTCGK